MPAIFLALLLLFAPLQAQAQSQTDGTGTAPSDTAATAETGTYATWYWVAGLVGVGVVADVISGGALSGPLFTAFEGLAVRGAGTLRSTGRLGAAEGVTARAGGRTMAAGSGQAIAVDGMTSGTPRSLSFIARDTPKHTGPAGIAIDMTPYSGFSGAGRLVTP